ncbi:hypothetical protein ACJJTC_015396 [Scirpophaga incertulas]
MNFIGLCRSSTVHRLVARMISSELTYEAAILKLNSLQSNKATLDQALKDIKNGQKCTNIENMERYLSRTGVTLANLDQLSVIHVAGTKGKGSTSAMSESILRHHGYRTGFYSVTTPSCSTTQEFEGDMPKYFAFLTVLAFNIFLKEKVEVAIIEVGIGGVMDSTNVLRNVPVVGITALGLDHTSILGDTLSQIAAAKAGIMKPGCEAFTVEQPQEAMNVLVDVAQQVKCTLNIVPHYDTYTFPNGCKYQLQSNIESYQTNASLAIQLAHSWMRLVRLHARNRNSIKKYLLQEQLLNTYIDQSILSSCEYMDKICEGMVTLVPVNTALGLKECRWPGRYQIVDAEYATFYLDGAHTKESMEICSKWFSENNENQDKVMIFSATGDRVPDVLLSPLRDIDFRHVYFVTPSSYGRSDQHRDNYSQVEHKELMARCYRNSETWTQLKRKQYDSKTIILESVSSALTSIKQSYKGVGKPSVLVTGSLHLVGATLSIIDPLLTSS